MGLKGPKDGGPVAGVIAFPGDTDMRRFLTAWVRPALLSAVLATITLPRPAGAGTPHRYVEDFSADSLMDPANTTAAWNTGAGTLGLPPFVVTRVAGDDTPGYSRDLAVDGHTVCVADGNTGLLVYDVTNPVSPVRAGTYDSPGFASDVAIDGDVAYLADGLSGVQVVDIGDPASPVRIGGYPTTEYARGVTVDGDLAYVAESSLFGNSRLVILDIRNPAQPAFKGAIVVPSFPVGVVIDGDVAYVATAPGGLNIIDVSNPSAPAALGSFPTPDYTRSVTVAGRYAYLGTATFGLYVLDVSDPSAPVFETSWNTPGYSFGVAADGDRVYLADDDTGLMVFDVTDPLQPVYVQTVDTPGNSIGVAVDGAFAYVADGPGGLQVIRTGEAVAPLPFGATPSGVSAAGVLADGDVAHVADPGAGLRAVDIADPGAPLPAGTAASPRPPAGGMARSGPWVYAATGDSATIEVFSAAAPSSPTHTGSVALAGETWGVTVRGDRVFVANGASGLGVLDIGDPGGPVVAGAAVTANPALAVAVSGNRAYVTTLGGGIEVFDVLDPSAPVAAGSHDNGDTGRGVAVRGNTAYVAAAGGLRVYDVSDPGNPVPAGFVAAPSPANAVAVAGRCAVVASGSGAGSGSIQVIDVGDPANPVEIGRCAAGDARDVVVAGDIAYVAGGDAGLESFQVFERRFDRAVNHAQSLALPAYPANVVRVRLATTQADSIRWEVTADGGAAWQAIVPGAGWTAVAAPGADLRWRSTHTVAQAFANPAVSRAELDWLYDFAAIDSVVDVPQDAGGFVAVHFSRSGHDFGDAAAPVTRYVIQRRIEESGGWEAVDTLSAVRLDTYAAVVPTVADTADTIYSTYRVRAETVDSLVFFDSPPETGFAVDNSGTSTAVLISRFDVRYADGAVRIAWEIASADRLHEVRIYRARRPRGAYTVIARIAPAGTTGGYTDAMARPGVTYGYRIGAVDRDGEFFSPETDVTPPVRPSVLRQNAPNPFNPSTTIPYEIGRPGRVRLEIFDVSGRRVRTLVDAVRHAGRHTAAWDGRDGAGRRVASGVYFYRLRAPGFDGTRKMTLIE